MADAASVLGVRVAGESHALSAGGIAEIIRLPPCTRLPHAPASLHGLANLRGAVLPVVSLARLLGRESGPPTGASRIVVLDRRVKLGLLVDEVTTLADGGDRAALDLDILLARDFAPSHRRAGPARVAADAPRAAPSRAMADDRLALVAIEAAGQAYAWPLDQVQEIVRLPEQTTGVPQSEPAMLGVIALRDRLLPLVSLRALLGLPPDAAARTRARVIVTRLGGAAFGLVVDAVRDIVRVDAAQIDAVPAVLTRGTGEARIEGICRLDGGQRLLCILSPGRLFDEVTAAGIRAHAEQEEDRMPAGPGLAEMVDQFVIFRVGDEQYGLPIAAVDEVVRWPEHLTRVPRAPGFVEGAMSLRGRVVPVIDQRRRFAVAGSGASGGRIVVVSMDGLHAGFAVDAVSEILRVPAARLQPAPDLSAGAPTPFDRVAVEHDGRLILLIEPRTLLDQVERDLLTAMTIGSKSALPAAPPSGS